MKCQLILTVSEDASVQRKPLAEKDKTPRSRYMIAHIACGQHLLCFYGHLPPLDLHTPWPLIHTLSSTSITPIYQVLRFLEALS